MMSERFELTMKRLFPSVISISRFSPSISGLIAAFVACMCSDIFIASDNVQQLHQCKLEYQTILYDQPVSHNSMIRPFLNSLS